MNWADDLLAAGLLQFGVFGEEAAPVKLSLEMLPAYPDVLASIAASAAEIARQQQPDRLVCTAAALPLGVAVSLHADIPLVYSRGSDGPGVHDLVGAYDVGHPALLLTDAWPDPSAQLLIERAQQVGLDIDTVIAVIGVRPSPLPEIAVHTLLDLGALAREMAADGRLPVGQAHAVAEWIARTG